MRKNFLSFIALMLLILTPTLVSATVDFDQGPSTEDQATFDQILEPVMKIYNLVKYFASALAGVVLLFSGASYMTSGADPRKRENSKNMAMYVVIGLLVIWAAPMVVNLIV